MNINKFENMIGRFRYISIIAVISAGLGSALMFVTGDVVSGS
jgi:hypothetical protein